MVVMQVVIVGRCKDYLSLLDGRLSVSIHSAQQSLCLVCMLLAARHGDNPGEIKDWIGRHATRAWGTAVHGHNFQANSPFDQPNCGTCAQKPASRPARALSNMYGAVSRTL